MAKTRVGEYSGLSMLLIMRGWDGRVVKVRFVPNSASFFIRFWDCDEVVEGLMRREIGNWAREVLVRIWLMQE